MGFQGIIYRAKVSTTIRSVNGFYGLKIKLTNVSPVKIIDYRGKGLANVLVEADNPTSGIPFIGYTDSSGSVFMQLDAVTDITITKDQIVKIVQYNGELSPTYTIDLDFIQK